MKKVKPLIIKNKDTGEVRYTLEFNRESVKFAEKHGFCVDEVAKFPMTNLPLLFHYAFRMYHKGITQMKTDEVLQELCASVDTELLFTKLSELYAAPFNYLLGDSDEEDGEERKNSKYAVER